MFVFAMEHLDRWLKEKKGASLIKSCLQTLSGHPWTPSASTSWPPLWGLYFIPLRHIDCNLLGGWKVRGCERGGEGGDDDEDGERGEEKGSNKKLHLKREQV